MNKNTVILLSKAKQSHNCLLNNNSQDKLTESNSNTNSESINLKKIGIIIGGAAAILGTISKVIDLINDKDNL